jgi:hypothetical protein
VSWAGAKGVQVGRDAVYRKKKNASMLLYVCPHATICACACARFAVCVPGRAGSSRCGTFLSSFFVTFYITFFSADTHIKSSICERR